MPEKYNILITSAGKRCQLIECFRQDATSLGLTGSIVAADLTPSMSPACQIADRAVKVPRCTDPDYTKAILTICREHSIKLVVPTIDTELQILSKHAGHFQELGCLLAISTSEAIQLSQVKFATSKAVEEFGIPIPNSSMLLDFDPNSPCWKYPLIFKPNAGSNSQGLAWANTPQSIPEVESKTNYLVQECLQGTEYTTNCYFDQNGKLLAAVPHERVEVRGGEVSKAITRKIPQLEEFAHRIEAAKMGWKGPICFQTIERDGVHYLFEINARFGGGYPIAHQAGAPFTKWLIQESLGQSPIADSDWKDGVIMLRFDTAVFPNG
jgi:carbamoyl-phosphate synthase large subunit